LRLDSVSWYCPMMDPYSYCSSNCNGFNTLLIYSDISFFQYSMPTAGAKISAFSYDLHSKFKSQNLSIAPIFKNSSAIDLIFAILFGLIILAASTLYLSSSNWRCTWLLTSWCCIKCLLLNFPPFIYPNMPGILLNAGLLTYKSSRSIMSFPS